MNGQAGLHSMDSNRGSVTEVVHLHARAALLDNGGLDPADPWVQRTSELIHDEFWADVPGASAQTMAARLAQAVPEPPAQAAGIPALAVPVCRVAVSGTEVLGAVNLVDFDDPNPRLGSPWLAGLVVVPAWRGRGLGSSLVRVLLADVRRLGFPAVFLGTDSPAFYLALGAAEHCQWRAGFWILRFDLAAGP
jgi:GNAT superfamily N-acetyltransferase